MLIYISWTTNFPTRLSIRFYSLNISINWFMFLKSIYLQILCFSSVLDRYLAFLSWIIFYFKFWIQIWIKGPVGKSENTTGTLTFCSLSQWYHHQKLEKLWSEYKFIPQKVVTVTVLQENWVLNLLAGWHSQIGSFWPWVECFQLSKINK